MRTKLLLILTRSFSGTVLSEIPVPVEEKNQVYSIFNSSLHVCQSYPFV
jgi:hypothetical protein